MITKHIRNLFPEGELARDAVCAKFAHTTADSKPYQVNYYNLDVVVSFDYQLKSPRGMQFRLWTTRTFKEPLSAQSQPDHNELLLTDERVGQ